MKLINLVFQGITGREESYDFGNKAVGCIVLQDANKTALTSALSFAFYGSVDPTAYELPLAVNVKFMIDDVEYDLTRVLEREESGAVEEKVALVDLNDGTIYGEGKEDIDAYILSKIGLDKDAFEKLLFIDEEGTASIMGSTSQRESFVAEQIASLATSQKVIGKYNALKEEESNLNNYIADIEVVTRDEIKEQTLGVDNAKISLDALRKQIEEVNLEILYAEKYREELDEYNVANAKMETLLSKQEEMSALAEKAARSEEAKEIASVFYKYVETVNGLNATEESIIADTKKMDELEAKLEESKGSEMLLGDEYKKASIRATELNAKLREIVKEGAVNPQNVKIKDSIETYYAEIKPEIVELEQKEEVLTKEYEELNQKIAELTERKLAIRESAEYKRAVQDGAVLQGNQAQLESSLKESEVRLEGYEKRRAELYDQNQVFASKIKELMPEVKKLEKELKGKNENIQDTLNQDALYKQTIYTKHLFVSDREVERDAVVTKIEKVKEEVERNRAKRDEYKKAKEEVLAYRQKLLGKRELLEEKLTEYMSYNHLRDISNDIFYGSRCPICDGFVAHKNELPLRDTKALDDQIKAVDVKIRDTESKLLEAESGIGQFEAALFRASEYLKSLEATRIEHTKAIISVLREYNVKSVKELFVLASNAVADSNALVQKVDYYKKKKSELARNIEKNNLVVEEIKYLDAVSIPNELEIIKQIRSLLTETNSAYDALKGFYKEKDAISLLQELQVTEAEYEALEKEIEANEARLKEVSQELDEVSPKLIDLKNRNVLVQDGDQALSYGEVVTKAYSEFLSAIAKEIEANEEAKERAKLRIQGLKKVTGDMEAEVTNLREHIIARVASLESAQETLQEMYAEYEVKFDALGIKTTGDLEALIIPDDELESLKTKIFAYDEDVAVTRDDIVSLNESINAHIGYYENYESNVQLLENLRSQEIEAVLALSNAQAVLEDMEYRYAELLNSNKSLTFVQGKIKGVEDLSSAIKEGALIASDLASLIVERANAIVKLASKNRYYVEEQEGGKLALILAGKGKARVDKLTKEESVLLPFAVAKAFGEIMVELLAGDTVSVLVVSGEKSDKLSIAPIVEYSKEKEMVVIPEVEKAFLSAVSKLA